MATPPAYPPASPTVVCVLGDRLVPLGTRPGRTLGCPVLPGAPALRGRRGLGCGLLPFVGTGRSISPGGCRAHGHPKSRAAGHTVSRGSVPPGLRDGLRPRVGGREPGDGSGLGALAPEGARRRPRAGLCRGTLVGVTVADAQGELCIVASGDSLSPKTCPEFCCGTCYSQYCCSDVLKKSFWNKEGCADLQDSVQKNLEKVDSLLEKAASSLEFTSDIDTDPLPGFGATIAIGLTIFVLFIVTIIVCFTCSCCCLYKMCRRPRPVVTTTTSTTVVHAPYPQPPGVPPSYPGPSYQGYHPIPPQPGMVAAPYPAQYPPPYPAHPVGPPAYHETLAGDAAMAYPASQPPYNPAYMDPPKATR